MAREITLTGTTTTSLGIVPAGHAGFSIVVRAASDLDSGTLTIGTRPSESTGVIETLSTDVGAGGTATYTIGVNMELFGTCSGASAAVSILVAEYS